MRLGHISPNASVSGSRLGESGRPHEHRMDNGPTNLKSYRDDVGLPFLHSVTTSSSSDTDWPSTRTLAPSLPFDQHQRPLTNGRIPSANASLQHATAPWGATGNRARWIRERVETTSSFHPKRQHDIHFLGKVEMIFEIKPRRQHDIHCLGKVKMIFEIQP